MPGVAEAAASAFADGNGVADTAVADAALVGVADPIAVGDCGIGVPASFLSCVVAAVVVGVAGRAFGGERGLTTAERTPGAAGPGAPRAGRGNSERASTTTRFSNCVASNARNT